MPKSALDINSSALFSQFNIINETNDDIITFFIDFDLESKFIESALENLEKTRIESITSNF